MKVRHSAHILFTTEVEDIDSLGGAGNERSCSDIAKLVQEHMHETIVNAVIKLGGEDISLSQGYNTR